MYKKFYITLFLFVICLYPAYSLEESVKISIEKETTQKEVPEQISTNPEKENISISLTKNNNYYKKPNTKESGTKDLSEKEINDIIDKKIEKVEKNSEKEIARAKELVKDNNENYKAHFEGLKTLFTWGMGIVSLIFGTLGVLNYKFLDEMKNKRKEIDVIVQSAKDTETDLKNKSEKTLEDMTNEQEKIQKTAEEEADKIRNKSAELINTIDTLINNLENIDNAQIRQIVENFKITKFQLQVESSSSNDKIMDDGKIIDKNIDEIEIDFNKLGGNE